MATAGQKRKPAALLIVDGSHNVTRQESLDVLEEKVRRSSQAFGPLVRPKSLKGHALRIWKALIVPAWWLDDSKRVAAEAFAKLYAEFVRDPDRFPSSRHQQMRAYMSELGLTDERQRTVKLDENVDEFFDKPPG